jgi:hypothetical protein
MYGIQFEDPRGAGRRNLALIDRAVHSLIPVADSDPKVAQIRPVLNRHGIRNVGDFIGAGGR